MRHTRRSTEDPGGVMTHNTPIRVIERRYDGERIRCIRWAFKYFDKVNPTYNQIESKPEIISFLKKKGVNIVGFVPWESQTNGDRWIGMCVENIVEKDSGRVCEMSIIPIYHWHTEMSQGVLFFSKNILREGSEVRYEDFNFMYTPHCLSRFCERLGIDCDDQTLLSFLLAITPYSIVYTYRRSGKPTIEIANQFGVFRSEHVRGRKINIIRTFIAKEQLVDIDLKRYNEEMEFAKTNNFYLIK